VYVGFSVMSLQQLPSLAEKDAHVMTSLSLSDRSGRDLLLSTSLLKREWLYRLSKGWKILCTKSSGYLEPTEERRLSATMDISAEYRNVFKD
jgi:hypothetical protein